MRDATYPVEQSVDLKELERRARELLPQPIFDFFAGGADEEHTLESNVSAWSDVWLLPRVLRGVEQASTETTVLGSRVAAPILVAPIGFQRLAHPRGEIATAEGAAAEGSLLVVSTRATESIEDIGAAGSAAPRWFQLYILKDRSWTAELVFRAEAAGYSALVLTADAPILGRRLRDERNTFSFPQGISMANVGSQLPVDATELRSYSGAEHDPGIALEDLEWLRGLSHLPIVVKGILRADDAVACVEAGAAAVVVSNHGGRQLDGAVATAVALPHVASAVDERTEVYVDGGIRSGTDVLKALALGARAVMIGRPVMWGLATGGAEGVANVLGGLRRELSRALVLSQVASAADVSLDLLASIRTVSSPATERR